MERRTVDREQISAVSKSEMGKWDLIQVIPLITIVVLIVMITTLLWFLNRNENERIRTTLISDALWVEQTLRFQMTIDEDAIARLALEQGEAEIGFDILRDRARLHLRNNPEVLRIVWRGADGKITASVPATAVDTIDTPDAAARPKAPTARPIYSPLLRTQDGDLFTVISMGIDNGGGSVAATVSIKTLIARQIPWWITEKYAVQLIDSSNNVLTEKTRVEGANSELSHRISFDPPLAGTWLSIAAYRVSGNFSSNLLLFGILGLALFAIFSLVILYRNTLWRRRAEIRLRSEMAFRQSMEESLTVGLRARNHDGKILYVNNAFCQMTGFSLEELHGRAPPMPYWLEDRIDETLARHEALNRGGRKTQSFETRFRRKDGSELDIQVFEAPLIDANGNHRGWMGSIIDISDQKRAEELSRMQSESLQRSGRLVALGEMASSLAHELNQPLAAITSYAAGMLNLLSQGNNDGETLIPVVEKISSQAQRAGQIIRRIQDFVRKRDPKFEYLSLASVIEDTAAFLEANARNNHVKIQVTAPKGLADVRADRILMEQVLINLMRNGIEAMAAVGKAGAVLEVELIDRAETQVIEVRDHGSGISDTVASRLFEPFVTNKPDGMGMGLNICRTIIELHQGKLNHRANDGGGTIFTVELPVKTEPSTIPAGSKEASGT